MWHHVLGERITAGCDDRLAPRRRDRFSGNAKWQLGDQQTAQRVAGHVDALPEGRGAEQDGATRIAKPGEQSVALLFSVDEQRIPAIERGRAKCGCRILHFAVAREEHEYAAASRFDEIDGDTDNGRRVRYRIDVRRWQVGRDGEHRLALEVKGRRINLGVGFERSGQTEPARDEREFRVRRQRRAGDDRRFRSREQIVAQNWREVERDRRRGNALIAAARLEPPHRSIPRGRIEGLCQRIASACEAPRDGTQLGNEREGRLVLPLSGLHSLADESQAVEQDLDLGDGVVERNGESAFPDRIGGEIVGQSHGRLHATGDERRQHLEQRRASRPRPLDRRIEA